MEDQFWLVFLHSVNDQSTVLQFKFFFVKMSFNETYSIINFDIWLIVKDQISHSFISIESNFSTSWKAQSAVLNFNIFDCFKTKLLWNLFSRNIFRQVENISWFLIPFILWNHADPSGVTEMHWDFFQIW